MIVCTILDSLAVHPLKGQHIQEALLLVNGTNYVSKFLIVELYAEYLCRLIINLDEINFTSSKFYCTLFIVHYNHNFK